MTNEIIILDNQDEPENNQVLINGWNADQLIDQFLGDTQNLMEKSKLRYKKSLKRYFAWVKISGFSLEKITLTELLVFKEYLKTQTNRDGDKLSTFTISAYLTAVKLFYEWANSRGLMINPAKSLKSEKKESRFRREPLMPDQMEKLLAHFKAISKRDYALICTTYYCGMRTIELSRLDVGDIEIRLGVRTINVQGKGKDSKNKWVKLRDEAYLPIMDYIATRENVTKNTPIFVSESTVLQSGGRLVPDTISRIIKSGLKAIGLDEKKYTAHSIRHSAATNAMRKGASIKDVQRMLRHADSKTTEGYLWTIEDEERLKNSAEDYL